MTARPCWLTNLVVVLAIVVIAGMLTGCASPTPVIDVRTVEVVKPVPVPCLTPEQLAVISAYRPARLGQTPYPATGHERESKLAAYAASQRAYMEVVESVLPNCVPPHPS